MRINVKHQPSTKFVAVKILITSYFKLCNWKLEPNFNLKLKKGYDLCLNFRGFRGFF